MKKLLYPLFIGLVMFAQLNAQSQIKLMGVSYNASTSSIDLIQWAAFDSLSVTTIPTTLDAYLYASSAFDPFNSSYYIAGVSGESSGLFSYDTDNQESTLNTASLLTNIAEFDMSTSKMYNLIMETEEYISIYEYDLISNEDTLLGAIYEPGVTGIVADAIGFDSNNGIIYYCGYTNDPALALYAIPVREESFSFTKTILTTPNPNSNITSLNFDNVNERLFATSDGFDANWLPTGRSIVEIDITSGIVNTLVELEDFPYFVGGSSQFDQNTGKFLLVGINSSDMLRMIAFDTNTNTYETGFVPAVSEIVCDNTLFARSTYIAAGIDEETIWNINIYPNPASEILNIETASNEPVQLQLFNTQGQLIYENKNTTISRMNIDISYLSSGLYTICLKGENLTTSKLIVVE
ncbi:MAG: T9SS type A sorting domain-containing protein [Flavobacteriales bacterium]